jgi:pyruvate dehydrogenase E1 component beta subunit
MPIVDMVGAINLTFHQELAADPKVVVFGEDVAQEGGVFRCTSGLLKKFGPTRVFDTPLDETSLCGVAIGMAINGLKPVVEVQFMGFWPPTFDHLINHAGRMRNRSRGRFTVPMVMRMPWTGGIHAPEHHSESMEAIMAHIPGIKVVTPATPYDAKGLLPSAIQDPDPVLFLEPKKIYHAFKEDIPEDRYTIPLGKAKLMREGEDCSIITWGAMTRVAFKAADELEKEKDWKCDVIDLRTLNPMDDEMITSSVQKTGRAVVLHEAPKTGGLGGEISATIMEKALLDLKAPVLRVTGPDTPPPLLKGEDLHLPNPARVKWAVKKVMEF